MRLGLFLTLLLNVQLCQPHDVNDPTFDSKVRELGTPAMALYEPEVATKKATFGMSWFWFPEAQFGSTKGIIRTRVGYAGGSKVNPSYYSLGDHTETVDLDYDPNVTDYAELLNIFWNNHDPCTKQKRQYMSAIFYHDEEQKRLAEKTMEEMASKQSKSIATQILPATEFYVAEEWVVPHAEKNMKKSELLALCSYHQKYMLQHHPWLLESLNINPGEQLISSHVAARLNGYIGGYGKHSDFSAEGPKLGLNEKMIEYVARKMKSKF